jgi:endonuclease G
MKPITVFFVLLLAAFNSFASNCPQLYPFGHEITVPSTIELCNSFYVIRFNDTTHANIFSSEILQPSGHQIDRLNNFHADTRTQSKVSPTRYAHSGFDKGHMVPAGDSTTNDQMTETFLMTNMSPQAGSCNRNNWKLLEEHVRKTVATLNQPTHVLTMALYNNPKLMNGIPIPSGYFKIVYTNPIQAYYADNIEHCMVKDVKILDVENTIGYKIH